MITKEDFIKILNQKSINYQYFDNKIIIESNNKDISLPQVKIIPCDVEFQNKGNINFSSLESIDFCINFKNIGDIYVPNLTEINAICSFNNDGDVDFHNSFLPIKCSFYNTGIVYANNKIISKNILCLYNSINKYNHYPTNRTEIYFDSYSKNMNPIFLNWLHNK